MNYNAVAQVIRRHKTFVVTTHINPDADAFGSALALAVVLKSLGKSVTVLSEDDVPGWLKFLPKTEWVKKSAQVGSLDYEVAIALDCGDLGRTGNVQGLLSKEKVLVNIDHHKTNDRFGNVNLVLPKASSTAEVLYELFTKMKVRFSKELATLLYAGIMTDTGSFRYDCTSARTHAIAGELLACGVNAQDMYSSIYDVVSINDLKLFMATANRVVFTHHGKLATLDLKRSHMKKFSDSFDVRDKIFGFLRSAQGVEVIVIFNEVEKNRTRVNFRSKGHVDVAGLAARFEGGGHAKASGCTLKLDMAGTRRKILSAIAKEL